MKTLESMLFSQSIALTDTMVEANSDITSSFHSQTQLDHLICEKVQRCSTQSKSLTAHFVHMIGSKGANNSNLELVRASPIHAVLFQQEL